MCISMCSFKNLGFEEMGEQLKLLQLYKIEQSFQKKTLQRVLQYVLNLGFEELDGHLNLTQCYINACSSESAVQDRAEFSLTR